MKRLCTIAACAGLWLAVLSFAEAADKAANMAEPPKSVPEVIAVTIHPAVPPRPALRYHLLPTFLERTPGNAVPFYGKAFACVLASRNWENALWRDTFDLDKAKKWLATPLDAIDRHKVQHTLGGFFGALSQVELAARREQCNWDMALRQGHIFSILLPETQQLRWFSCLVALKARLAMAEGKYADAIASLQTGYSMARQVAEQPFLVSGLVAMSTVGQMDQQLLTLCQQRDAPNLCWSLTELPIPMIDLRKSVQAEYDGLYLEFPKLQTVRHANYTPDQWERELRAIVAELVTLPALVGWRADTAPGPQDPAAVVARLLASAPVAKKDLAAAGYSQKELDTMAPSQLVLLGIVVTYDELRDEGFKLMGLPYWQAREGLDAFERGFPAARKRELLRVGSLLLPTLRPCALAAARTDRELAVLRCIEALRFYAAVHQGTLPTTLAEIKEVPIPPNPVTGKPFPYRLEGQTAILDADGDPHAFQYRVTVAK